MRLKTFTFSATQDDVDDDGESVKLTFGTPLPARVSAGTVSESTVNIQSKTPLTASVESAPPSHNGSDEFRIRIAFSEEPKTGFSYKIMRDHAFTVTGGSVTGARRLEPLSNIGWEVVVEPDSNGDAVGTRILLGVRTRVAGRISPALATRRRSSKVIWIRSGWLRCSIYWVLLVLGSVCGYKTIIPEAQEHLLAASGR